MNQPVYPAAAVSLPPAAALFKTSRRDVLAALPPCTVTSRNCEAHSKRLYAPPNTYSEVTLCEFRSTDKLPEPPPMNAPSSQFGRSLRSMPMAAPHPVEVARKV